MWRTALKQWNDGKEYWAIPRRDTGAYRQVIDIVDKLKNPAPVVRVEAVADPRKELPVPVKGIVLSDEAFYQSFLNDEVQRPNNRTYWVGGDPEFIRFKKIEEARNALKQATAKQGPAPAPALVQQTRPGSVYFNNAVVMKDPKKTITKSDEAFFQRYMNNETKMYRHRASWGSGDPEAVRFQSIRDWMKAQKVAPVDVVAPQKVAQPVVVAPQKKSPPKAKDDKKSILISANDELDKLVHEIMGVKSGYTYSNMKESLAKKIMAVIQKVNPSFDNSRAVDSFMSSVRSSHMDFFPTPTEALEKYFLPYLKDSVHVLEPTVGSGNILNFIRKHTSSDVKLNAVEFSKAMYDIAVVMNPDTKVTLADFLEYKQIENNIDMIICNPPFNIPGKKNAYYDFLFKCTHLLNQSTASSSQICFISPRIENLPYNGKNLIGASFGMSEVYGKMGKTKLGDILTSSGIAHTRKQLDTLVKTGQAGDDEFANELEVLEFEQAEYLGEIKGFGGTDVTGYAYHITVSF